MKKHVRLEVYFSGRVQGVGFRYRVRALAEGFFVTGTVRNLDDGRVELRAEGARDELEDFLKAIVESELGSHIREMDVDWHDATGHFKGFEIIR
jgi:acylphosphatase